MDIQKFIKQIRSECEWVSIRKMKEIKHMIKMRNMNLENLGTSEEDGYMISVIQSGGFGYSAVNTSSLEVLHTCFKDALQKAKNVQTKGLFEYKAEINRQANVGIYKSPISKNWDSSSLAQYLPKIKKINKNLMQNKIINSEVNFNFIDSAMELYSSNGTCIQQNFIISNFDLYVTAHDDGLEAQSRSYTNALQLGLEHFDNIDFDDLCNRLCSEAVELLYAEDCPKGEIDLVLSPDQMMLQIHESIGHPLEIDRILGDERNYAGSSFVKLEDFGTMQYGSPLMNIVFDPNQLTQIVSSSFDDEGKKAHKEYIIKNGKLLNGLGGLDSIARTELTGTASARSCSWNRPPIDRMSNLNLVPGTSTFEEIISKIDKGVYMKSNRSWSIDDQRNSFQFGCEFGRLIEDGKLTKVVKNPNYRGVTNAFWGNLESLGDQSTFEIYGLLNCGKGEPNQVIRVGHASPIAHFKNIEVFGSNG